MPTIINGTTGVQLKDNQVATNNLQAGCVVDTSLTLTANSNPIKTALNASGSAPIYACRAWVNFNGTGTVAIRASGNVSSITDNGVGDYTVNFTTALPDANYSATCVYGSELSVYGGVNGVKVASGVPQQFTSSARIFGVAGASTTAQDNPYLSVSVFR
jgi:hypothetical protein